MARDQQAPLIGIVLSGAIQEMHTPSDIDSKMDRVLEAGVFDYVEHSPTPAEVEPLRRAVVRTGIPVRVGNHYYRAERDEPLLQWHLNVTRDLGGDTHNVQLFSADAQGRTLSDADVVAQYLHAHEIAADHRITVCFEVHVDMWSEQFERVARVGQQIEDRGVPFLLTLDASHLLFKIGQPSEMVRSGLSPKSSFSDLNAFVQQWISANWVAHAHARPAAINGPMNVWARHPDGRQGRGIQYPFLEPPPGSWHSAWHSEALDPWKLILKQLLSHHANSEKSPLRRISTEMIPFVDYGAGATYSLLENNAEIARWLRKTWSELRVGKS